MSEQQIRYLCRDQYNQDGSLESPRKLTADQIKVWLDEVSKILMEESQSAIH